MYVTISYGPLTSFNLSVIGSIEPARYSILSQVSEEDLSRWDMGMMNRGRVKSKTVSRGVSFRSSI